MADLCMGLDTCPDPGTLEQFLDGEVEHAIDVELAGHIGNCDACSLEVVRRGCCPPSWTFHRLVEGSVQHAELRQLLQTHVLECDDCRPSFLYLRDGEDWDKDRS